VKWVFGTIVKVAGTSPDQSQQCPHPRRVGQAAHEQRVVAPGARKPAVEQPAVERAVQRRAELPQPRRARVRQATAGRVRTAQRIQAGRVAARGRSRAQRRGPALQARLPAAWCGAFRGGHAPRRELAQGCTSASQPPRAGRGHWSYAFLAPMALLERVHTLACLQPRRQLAA